MASTTNPNTANTNLAKEAADLSNPSEKEKTLIFFFILSGINLAIVALLAMTKLPLRNRN